MPKKKYFSYIRVSTQRQGQHGTSLTEQQAAIEKYAESWNLSISKRFEERETAAKQGRPVFFEMLKQLKKGRADGVIIHKIDRSARNLKDWADLGALIDSGVDVQFASESLNLSSRGGRLSADIQAVVASDYIRNLREETKKGIYGRLKQGLYPFRAMIGYLDRGSGQLKEIDPKTAPMIRRAFELYATGDWGLDALAHEMTRMGLKSKTGRPINRTALSTILHSPFYVGIIRIKKTGETFAGMHRPIISRSLFSQVQDVFEGKNSKKVKRHFFVFRRSIKCETCKCLMTPEIQKGITYYRCRTKGCLRTCLKEETVVDRLRDELLRLQFNETENELLRSLGTVESEKLDAEIRATRKGYQLQQLQIKDRHSRLADAYVDGVFDEKTYLIKKNELVSEEQAINEKLTNIDSNQTEITGRLNDFFELANSAYLSYELATPEERRDLVKSIVSNFSSNGKSVSIKLKTPFNLVADRTPIQPGCPYRAATRTLTPLIKKISRELRKLSKAKSDDELIKSLTREKAPEEKPMYKNWFRKKLESGGQNVSAFS
jgi:site-specific DNA recombinase